MVILPSGSTTFCCADLNNRGKAGMIQDMDPSELFNSSKRRDFKTLFEANKKHEIELCASCNWVLQAMIFDQFSRYKVAASLVHYNSN